MPTDQTQHYLVCSPPARKMPILSAQCSVLFSGGCSVMILSPPDGNLPMFSLTAHPKPVVATTTSPVGFSRNPVHFSDNAAAYCCHQDFTNWHHLSGQLRTLGLVSASTDPPRRLLSPPPLPTHQLACFCRDCASANFSGCSAHLSRSAAFLLLTCLMAQTT